jgi:GNAT superfamily N-acetyltransferase
LNTKNNIGIRRARAEDAPQVHRMLVDLAASMGEPNEIKATVQDIERDGFGNPSYFETALGFDGDEAVGLVIWFREYSTWFGKPGVYVQDLYVADHLRGTGLGRDLLWTVRDWAREWGSGYVKLAVYGKNPSAIAFYQHLGFKLSEGEQPMMLREQEIL